jgi:glycosyltransferase involved in cell wall biosynthesis
MEVATPLRIIQLNLAYDAALSHPHALLAAYHTLSGWSDAMTRAGAAVSVIQRFARNAALERDGVPYSFVSDRLGPTPRPWDRLDLVVEAAADSRPDVVHVNGLMFPGAVAALRRRLPVATALVVQDHSGGVPRVRRWPARGWQERRWRRAYEGVDAVTFTATALARPWIRLGLPRGIRVLEILESSTSMVPLDRDEARAALHLSADPAIVWVGRLNANKDPLTALDALDLAMTRLPQARCWMLFGAGDLLDDVRRRIDGSDTLRARVTLVGAVPATEVATYLSAADIFLSASRHEGSGYALLEAMSCGAVPCVTAIPAFSAIVRDCGVLWIAGDASSCAQAIADLSSRDRQLEQQAVRARFTEALTWDAIARRTIHDYQTLVDERRGSAR